MERNYPRWNGKLDIGATQQRGHAYVTWWGIALVLWCLGYLIAAITGAPASAH